MVLELLIYAKSAMKNFDQSEASIVVIFWFGHYLKKKISENPLLGPIPQFFFKNP